MSIEIILTYFLKQGQSVDAKTYKVNSNGAFYIHVLLIHSYVTMSFSCQNNLPKSLLINKVELCQDERYAINKNLNTSQYFLPFHATQQETP